MYELMLLLVLVFIVIWALRPAVIVIRWILGVLLALVILLLIVSGLLFPDMWQMLWDKNLS